MRVFLCCILWFCLVSCAEINAKPKVYNMASLADTETAFAKTMKDRDFDAFASFIAADAVFINGGNPLQGKQKILNHWATFFKEQQAPFSWSPDIAEIGGGNLGYTEGPVLDATGNLLVRFYSTWQLQAEGNWLIIFDNGYSVCHK